MARNGKPESIDDLLKREDWSAARRLLQKELRKSPDSHWLLARLSTTYYEQHKYATALRLIKQAEALAPHCPLVLWDLAGTLDMTGDTTGAITIYRRLLRRGVDAIAHDECGEGLRWAASLLCDCLYRLGNCYLDLDRPRAAFWCFREHLLRQTLGVRSIYPLQDVKRRLAQCATTDAGILENELGMVERAETAV